MCPVRESVREKQAQVRAVTERGARLRQVLLRVSLAGRLPECPRHCGGPVFREWGEWFCLNCGWRSEL